MSTSNIVAAIFKIRTLSRGVSAFSRHDILRSSRAVARCNIHSSGTQTNVAPSTSPEEEKNKEELSDNDRVNPNFINRNPRNLERMAVARKDLGWSKSYPRKDYWHKLFIKKTNRHITAYIQHINGHVAVQASTKEWAIKQHLYSTSDVVASLNLGRVLAQRCLESGISYVHLNMEKERQEQEAIKAFLDALTDGGLLLYEPKTIVDFSKPVDYFPEVD
ncbi:large ribosomal subunit protein uL18m-like [Diadema setosum]|uniref:large ribosomal subunit protein uL18m-like n=1 Tax=Diadema setosum TaxID=31175 RepID=UPI003B3AA061